MAVDSADRREFTVKIHDQIGNGNGVSGETVGGIWREGSCEFWTDGQGNFHKRLNAEGSSANEEKQNDEGFEFRPGEDPPTKLIGQFLHKQQASGEISLDMELGMDELQSRGLTPVCESPSSARAPTTKPDTMGRRDSRSSSNCDGEVVKCSGNAPIQKNTSNLLNMRTRSRLSDPPTPALPPQAAEMKSSRIPKSGQLKSGFFGISPRNQGEEEDDDPFAEEDLPEEYRKDKFSLWIVLEWLSLILIIAALSCW